MDSRKYSMYRFFFSIPEDAFILCIGFFYRFRKMLLEAEIIDSVFYVSHHDYIYIYAHIHHVHMYICRYRMITYLVKQNKTRNSKTPSKSSGIPRYHKLLWPWSCSWKWNIPLYVRINIWSPGFSETKSRDSSSMYHGMGLRVRM